MDKRFENKILLISKSPSTVLSCLSIVSRLRVVNNIECIDIML